MKRIILVLTLSFVTTAIVAAGVWGALNGVTVGTASGNIGAWNGITIGPATGQIITWNGLTAYSGTTFNETWNQTDSCGVLGGSTCNQPWVTAPSAGSASSIVTNASSGCTGTSPYTNVLSLPPASTANAIVSYGSLPQIPNYGGAQAWDLYYYFCANTGSTNAAGVVELNNFGGGSNAFQMTMSGTSNKYYFSGTEYGSTISAGAWHFIHAKNNGSGTCEFQVDSGSYTTNTCSNNNFNQIRLAGTTATTTFYIGYIYLTVTSFPCAQTWPPSSFIDFAGASGTVTAAQNAAGTHFGNNGNATTGNGWAVTGLTGLSFAYGAAGTAFTNSLNVCKTSYAGNTGTSLEIIMTTTASSNGDWAVTMYTTYPAWAVGYEIWYTGGPPGVGSGFGFDYADVSESSGGTIGTMRFQDDGGGNPQFALEPNGFTNAPVAGFNPSASTHYWVSLWEPTSGTCYMNVYLRSTGALLGRAEVSGNPAITCAALSNPASLGFAFGKLGSETQQNASDVFITNYIVEYADAVGPILPQ